MNRIFIFLVFSTAFFSCDPIHDAEIRNETQVDIIFQISFNKEALGEGLYGRFLNYYPGFEHISPMSIDTINLICSYKITPGKSFPLHSKIAEDPNFKLFKELLILKPDSVFYKNEEEISNAFKQTTSRHWELIIK